MRSIEYLRWAPGKSPLSVEFPADLLLPLGWSDGRGALYGWRNGSEVRLASLAAPAETRADEEQEKVGIFVSRVRGDVFLTESDLAFLNQAGLDLALVVAGRRAGFFVREPDGSIQTVRSHEEFSISGEPERDPAPARPSAGSRRLPRWAPAIAFAGLPLAAFAVLPQRAAQLARSMEIREVDRQLLISWTPPENAVLTIDDGGAKLAIAVRAGQNSVTYLPRGGEVQVTLTGLHSISARYQSPAATHYK